MEPKGNVHGFLKMGSRSMRCIIVGCGRVGSTLAKLLDADGHEVIVVDQNPDAFKRLGQPFGGRVVVGTGIDYDVLKNAGAAGADAFVAVTEGDNRNIMAALIAQRMFKIKRIVARIYDPPRGQMYRELGVETVCPTSVGAKLIRDRLLQAPWDGMRTFDFGKLTALTAKVGDDATGKRVGDIEKPGRIRISAIRHGPGKVEVATEAAVLQRGDEVHAIVAPDAISDFAKLFAEPAPVEAALA
jgi:trk system potassium uptake protein TrkA